jgi:hypothetical protein
MNRNRTRLLACLGLIAMVTSTITFTSGVAYYAPIRDCSVNPNYLAFVGQYGVPTKFGLTWFWQRYNPNGVAYYVPDWGRLLGTRIYAVSSDFCVQIKDAAGRSITMWIPMRGFLDFTFVLQRQFKLPLLLFIYVW